MTESFEAVASVRRNYMPRNAPFEQKWVTVPTSDTGAAIAAFKAIGFEVRGISVLNQCEATKQGARL